MALIKKQEPDNLHSVFIPNFYTYQTDLSLTSDFRFKYELIDLNGSFFYGLTVPLENNLSFNTPVEILKSKTQFHFQPSITSISNIPDNVIVYNEILNEDVSGGDSTSWVTKSGLRYSNTDFVPTDNYIASSEDSDFLVNMPNEHDIRITDDFTFRTYNGYIDSESTIDAGLIYKFKIEVVDDGSQFGSIQSLNATSFISNPYFNEPASNSVSPDKNGDNFMIEIPAGINNWVNTNFVITSYVDSFGISHVLSHATAIIYGDGTSNHLWFTYNSIIYDIYVKNYNYYAYRWPFGDGGRISIKHKFNVIENCKFDGINVAWENTKGGLDYYLFTMANEKTVVMDKTIYNKNLYTLNIDNAIVLKNSYCKGKNIYRNNTQSVYEIQSNWMNQDEINGMEDLFRSTEVYMNLKGTWFYVISAEKKAVIYNKKRSGLKKYKLNFIISENKVRY